MYHSQREMHLCLRTTKKHLKFKHWKDCVGNKFVIVGNMERTLSSKLKFDGLSYIYVSFREVLKPPFTLMFIGEASGDCTYFDGVNQPFELCHGYPTNNININSIRTCVNLGKYKYYGKTDGLKLNMYTVIVDKNNMLTLRVNGTVEIYKKIKTLHLQGLIIGATRDLKFRLKGSISKFFITKHIFTDKMLQQVEAATFT